MTTTTRVGTAVAAAVVLGAGFVLSAQTDADAVAVQPGTTTAAYTCAGRTGPVELTAKRSGTNATVEVRLPGFKAPVPLIDGVLETELTLAKEGGGTVVFKGSDNPSIPRGKPVRSGPLRATVAEGDRLDSLVGARALTATVLGHQVTCTAQSKQQSGPFLF